MARSPEPTQSDVLRERFSRVPWRRALGDVLRARIGRGPMVLPDRLEGAVLGQLLATAGGDPDDEDDLLEQLERLLAGGAPPEREPVPSAPRALAAALVLRDAPVRELAASAALVAAGERGDPSIAASGVLYALVIRRFLAGGRELRSVRARARRDAAKVVHGAIRDAIEAGDVAPFDAAWQAFERAGDPDAALMHPEDLLAPGTPVASAAILGGLVGARWGSSVLKAAKRQHPRSVARARPVIDRLIETDDPAGDDQPWQTSTSEPLVVCDVDVTEVDPAISGGIGITPLPGRRYVAYHTGAHWRDLDADAGRLRELGVDLLFLLVEDRELARCRVTDIEAVLRDHDIDLVRYPIRDPLVPRDQGAFQARVAGVLAAAHTGRRVAVACRGGFDRAGMTAACLLREAGLDATTAIDRVQRARPGALSLPDQQAYVRAWPSG